jgi:hypothetical protein
MGDRIIITDEDPTPRPRVVAVVPETKPEVEKVITEKTTIVETKNEKPV